jgi:transcription antitermination factor NusG
MEWEFDGGSPFNGADLTLRSANSGHELSSLRWYAVQVHSRKEQLIASQLETRSLECFLPKYKSLRKWSDRTKEVEQALFPGYVFCRFDYDQRQPVVTTTGVLQIVGNGPTPIADSEITALQAAVASGLSSQPWPYLEVGERVRVTYGHLAGLEGILVNFKGNHRVVLSVTLLQRSVAMEVDLSWLTPVPEQRQQLVPAGVGCPVRAVRVSV